jgi:Raf kinase inhibitor-like YbhB/YbcL family protein
MICKSLTLVASFALFAANAFASDFTLTSPDITHGKPLSINQVFNGFGCTGKNHSPALVWQNAPKGTKAFALSVYDPDAPTGSGWWHWVVYNVPATTTALPENAGSVGSKLLPKDAEQARTDFGEKAFGGACPPVGDKPHRYQFTVTALKDFVPLQPTENPSPAMVGYYVNQLALGKATITATYGR